MKKESEKEAEKAIRAENGDTTVYDVEDYVIPKPPKSPPSTRKDTGWRPRFNPGINEFGEQDPNIRSRQELIFEDTAMYCMAYGERASGKTYGALHALVRHCYENDDALAIIIVGVKRQAEEGGAWHKLLTMILPEWEEGLGFDHDSDDDYLYSEPKSNTAKDIYVWIRTATGGFSRVLLLSMPVGSHVADRVKGMEPSFCLVDEAQTLLTDTYFKHLVQQIGRRPGIKLQQIIYACNPAGPSHWLYKRFFEMSGFLEDKLDPRYSVYHVPMEENRHNISDLYWENMMEAVRGDPIEHARMIKGEWIERPSGLAIFIQQWKPSVHVRGTKTQHITPVPNIPIIVGYDPGPVNFSIHMMQKIRTSSKFVWSIFDEMNYVGERQNYSVIIPALIKRMDFWGDFIGFPFEFGHVCDEAAWNQRDREGSFDNLEIEKLSRNVSIEDALAGKGAGTERIKLTPAPKGTDSVPARVSLIMTLLEQECLVVSSRCVKTIMMFEHLESQRSVDPRPNEKYDPQAGMRPKRSMHIHPFDSMSYPIWKDYTEPGDMRFQNDTPVEVQHAAPGRMISCGQG